jgi:3-deoxy-D-manno-octulosonic-acid transferase
VNGLPAFLRLYRLATGLAEPVAPLVLARRVRRGKEEQPRLRERLGHAAAPRPGGPLVWIHGASVGESLSHLPLVERFVRERPDIAVLVTSGTATSAALLAQRLPPGVIHQYVPIDAPGAARRFIDHWRPDLAVFVESELWPNLLIEARARGARLALLAARISEASAKAWGRAPAAARAMLGLFDLIYAQDGRTAAWIEGQGAEVAGRLDLKRAASPLPCDDAALERLLGEIGGRGVVAAASTHEGEEALIADVVRSLGAQPLLILVPRHPERGAGVAEALRAAGWRVAQRSAGEPIGPETQAYVADTLGELGLFYRLADVVVMGASLIEGLSGHNPLEPARLGKPVISGPNVDAFAEVYAELLAAQAVLIAHDPAELAKALAALLAEAAVAEALGERGRRVAAIGEAALDAAFADLQDLLPSP